MGKQEKKKKKKVPAYRVTRIQEKDTVHVKNAGGYVDVVRRDSPDHKKFKKTGQQRGTSLSPISGLSEDENPRSRKNYNNPASSRKRTVVKKKK